MISWNWKEKMQSVYFKCSAGKYILPIDKQENIIYAAG